MTLIGCAAVAVCVVFIALYLKNQQREIALLLIIACSIVLFTVGVKNISQATKSLYEITKNSGYSAEVETMLKALGLAAVSQISSDVCREAGESTLASQVEFIGRIEIMALSVPLINKLFSVVQAFLT